MTPFRVLGDRGARNIRHLGVAGGGGDIVVIVPTITPTLGPELLSNGNMETGSPPTGWGAYNSAVLASQADERTGGSGTKSISVARNGNAAPYTGQVETVTINDWFLLTAWQRNVDAVSVSAKLHDGTIYAIHCGGWGQTSTVWTNVVGTGRATDTGTITRMLVDATAKADGVSGRFDDVSLKKITFSTMQSDAVASRTGTAKYQCNPTVTDGTQAGMMVQYLDDDNFILAYLNRGTGTVPSATLLKRVAGTYTSVISASVTYAASAPLTLLVSGTSFSLFYNYAQVGVTTAITDALGTSVKGFSSYVGNSV